MSSPNVRVVIVMGVAGVGKTTIGRALASALGVEFVDADDFHGEANVEKMRRGEALDDHDRAPWLAALRVRIEQALAEQPIVLACSALRHAYRRALGEGDPRVAFVMLDAPDEVVAARLATRSAHFAGTALLPSQRGALEAPESAIRVDASRPIDEVVAAIRSALDRRSPPP